MIVVSIPNSGTRTILSLIDGVDFRDWSFIYGLSMIERFYSEA